MAYAVRARLLQFEAGPMKQVFFACEGHRDKLGIGTTDVMCFFATSNELPYDVDEEEEISCDFCREG